MENNTPKEKATVRIQCFGRFEAYINEEPIKFKRNRTRELLAYLVHREGDVCTNKELSAQLWGSDQDHYSALRDLMSDLKNTFIKYGCEDVLIRERGSIAINVNRVKCDYYDWCKDSSSARYKGEYMEQYGWGEDRHAELENFRINEIRNNTLKIFKRTNEAE